MRLADWRATELQFTRCRMMAAHSLGNLAARGTMMTLLIGVVMLVHDNPRYCEANVNVTVCGCGFGLARVPERTLI